jgi:hypothetical protein
MILHDDEFCHRFGRIAQLGRECGIPGTTLSYWRKKIKENLDWTPWESLSGEHLKTFTDEQEQELADIVWERMTKHMLATNAEFREIATKFWGTVETKHMLNLWTVETKTTRCACVARFISLCKNVHKFSSRRSRFKSRSHPGVSEIRKWIAEVTEYLMDKPRDDIINCDETYWLVLPKNLMAWAPTGAGSVYIRAEGGGAEKDRITVHASIKADGTKLLLLFIAQGRTVRVEETQIGNVVEHCRTHTANGWQTEESLRIYLDLLRDHIGGVGDGAVRIYLIADRYPAHMTDLVKQTAGELNIEMIHIPVSCADECQPLDRRIFGPFKAEAKRRYRIGFQMREARGKIQACQDMIPVWNELCEYVTPSAWAHLIPESQTRPGEDDRDSDYRGDDGRWSG